MIVTISKPPVSLQASPPSIHVTILRYCRCQDCHKFVRTLSGDMICQEGIGGMGVVWGTGERICDPPPDAWHYCSGYDGPQISKDVWVWPRMRTDASAAR